MPDADTCGAPYARDKGEGVSQTLRCHYLPGHQPAEHSWHVIKMTDAQRARSSGNAPADVDVLIENIAGGECDPYLEAILAAAHGRKRALRNVTRPYGRAEAD